MSSHLKFRNAMDEESLRERLILRAVDNPIYDLAARAAGHQSAFTVDQLSSKLKECLPTLIADLAAKVEAENEERLAAGDRP